MTSGFEAPSGPAASVPPPPPPTGGVPSPPNPAAVPPPAPGLRPPPPPPAAAPSPPPAAEPAPAPVAQPPAPAAPSPDPPAPTRPPAPPAPTDGPATETPTSGVEESHRVTDRHDLSDLLDQLHEDLDLEPAAAPASERAPLTDPRDLERPEVETIVIESTGGLAYRPVFASFGSRLGGVLIDGLALSIAMVPGLLVILQTSGEMNTMLGLVLLVVGFLAANVSYARSVSKTGQWFGNRVTHTKVVSATNGANLDVGFAGVRFAARHLVSVILLFGFVVGLTDSQRRTFHDRLAGSIVVGRPRATWSAGDDDA